VDNEDEFYVRLFEFLDVLEAPVEGMRSVHCSASFHLSNTPSLYIYIYAHTFIGQISLSGFRQRASGSWAPLSPPPPRYHCVME
jgi:hypothetical protein